MKARICTLGEKEFLVCVKAKIWGSEKRSFKNWDSGDYLIFLVDKAVAGLAKIAGTSFDSVEQVWDNGLFPHRIPITFTHVYTKENRLLVKADIRDLLISEWGNNYGWGIITKTAIHGPVASKIIELASSNSNEKLSVEQDLEKLIQRAGVP